MSTPSCFYSQSTCVPSLSREHIISASVLKAVFGDPVKNVVNADFLGDKTLYNHEHVIRDVCEKCNNEGLSQYDVAGVCLIKQLTLSDDPTGLRIFFSREILGWLLKTHLNHMRIIKDKISGDTYPIHQEIKSALIQHAEFPHSFFKLLIEGWAGEHYFWDADDHRRITWFKYTSVCFPSLRIVISELRIKTLRTWIIIPSDANYDNFEERVSFALDEVMQKYGHQLQHVNSKQSIEDGYIDLVRVLPIEQVKKYIVQYNR